MYELSEELKDNIKQLNSKLKDKYHELFVMNDIDLRKFIDENVGKIEQIDKLNEYELEKYLKNGGIVGVDGSKNKKGGAYPHYVEIYQGLAKSSICNNEPIFKADFYTPLYLEKEKDLVKKLEENENKEEAVRNYKFAGIEVDVALESLKRFNPYVVMMDGSLIRYHIECLDKWTELRKECEKRGVILIGVIKDIKTSIVGNQLEEKRNLEISEYLYDREVLYGLLKCGEIVTIRDEVSKKFVEGFSSIFMRSSTAPSVIGMDMLDTQSEHLKEMARLVFTLTPQNSRGVPLWLDIVDSEVKISDKMMRYLLETYLDREILEKFFVSERDKRTL